MKQKKIFSDSLSESVAEEVPVWNRGKIIIWVALSIVANWCTKVCLDMINNKRSFIWAASVIVFIVIGLPILVKYYLGDWEENIINWIKKILNTQLYNLLVWGLLMFEFIYILYIFYDKLLK